RRRPLQYDLEGHAGPARARSHSCIRRRPACSPALIVNRDLTLSIGFWTEMTMRAWRVTLLAAFICAGCTAQGGIYPSTPYPPPTHDSVAIPPGHMPPPGECRIWHPDRPPGHQPPPGDCAALRHRVPPGAFLVRGRSEEHTSELQSRENLVCRLLLEKKNSHMWLCHAQLPAPRALGRRLPSGQG